MGWLLRQPESMNIGMQLYTVGQQKIVLLIGLGNAGSKYEANRHNVGFLCIDAFVTTHEQMSPWEEKKSLKCHLAQGRFSDTLVIAIKPTTSMNLSGEAVTAVMHFYKVEPQNILVLHDELDIPFGQVRLRVGGSSAGHNGIKSITQIIGESYGRLRVGIGPKRPATIDSADFVLQNFSTEEKTQLSSLNQEVNAILIEYIYGGELPHETRSFLV
ncbi:MAG: aminoacyl-tRNA hydrolase [Candidatus Saccharimonadales bacterium]